MVRHISTSNLSAIHKARKIADLIVKQNTQTLQQLYTNITNPLTFEKIGENVWPQTENKPNGVKFVRTVIYMALQDVLTKDALDYINTYRDNYFWKELWKTIEKNGWKKVVDKIRFLAGKKNWENNGDKLRELYKERIERLWFVAWYPDEISFLDAMLQDPNFYHKTWWNKWFPDYSQIVPLLNEHLHDNEHIRTARTISNFLYKRARCNWMDQELDCLSMVTDSADLQFVASYLNHLCHEWLYVRTPESIAYILRKKKVEQKKMKKLGIV